MEPTMVGVVGICAFLVLLILRVPIAFCFAIVGFSCFAYLRGLGPALALLSIVPYTWATNFTLLTLPLFVLMGLFAGQSGISRELFDTGYKWLGRLVLRQ